MRSRNRLEEVRSIIRMLILESNSTVGFKMIFLGGLPGGGKSTLLKRLGIENQFTNCNIDNFYEGKLKDAVGTSDLAQVEDDYFALHNKRRDFLEGKGPDLTAEEVQEYERLSNIRTVTGGMFQTAIKDFKAQVDEVCKIGSNFIIDGTASNSKMILEQKERFEGLGYSCAMIFVDIDVNTSVQRNIERGKSGGRSIANHIIRRQGKHMHKNIEPYEAAFGSNFFLVENRGTMEDYHAAIDAIKDGVEDFMR